MARIDLPQLDIRDLDLVLALAASGTTAGAASSVHITQSAVSRALAQAEEKLGVRLFERSRRGLTATAAGERLIAGASTLIAALAELEQRVTAPAQPPVRIRLACECYTAYRWLPSALADLRRALPRLEVEIALEQSRDPVSALIAGEIELALLTTGALPPAREMRRALTERPLFADEIVFLVGREHPLAAQRSITADQLRSTALITFDVAPAEHRWFLRQVFGRRSPRLDITRLPLTEAIVDAARAGLGVAVLSEWVASSYLGSGDLLVRRLSTGPLRRPWRAAYRTDVAEAAERLLAVVARERPHPTSLSVRRR